MNQVSLIGITTPKVEGLNNAEDLVAYAARVSNPSNQFNTLTAPKLLKYLVNNKHWSPFEMISLTMEIKTTRDIGRQILRHRSFSFQEFSQRYADPTIDAKAIIREARIQDTKNRQNSFETQDFNQIEWWTRNQAYVQEFAFDIYKEALARGIAKEQARVVLPEGLTPSTMYMAGTLRSWIHYVQLRTEIGTQKEHREIAQQCQAIIEAEIPSIKSLFNNEISREQ